MLRVHTFSMCLSMCLVVLGLFAAPAWAQESPDLEQAKAHYLAAEQALQSGAYATATTEYAAAYEITKDPVLFYKLAVAHEKAGQCDEALTWYRRYLAEGRPDEQFKALTEERIAACEAGHAEQPAGVDSGANPAGGAVVEEDGGADGGAGDVGRERTADERPPESDDVNDFVAPPPQAPPSFIDRPTSWKSEVAWSSLTAGIGFGIAGAVFALSASAQKQDLENLIAYRYPNGEPAEYSGTVATRYDEIVNKGKTHATWSRISLAAAGASVGAAVLFFVLDAKSSSEEERAAQIVPLVSSERVGMTAGWRF